MTSHSLSGFAPPWVRKFQFEDGLVLLNKAANTLVAYNGIANWIWSRLDAGAVEADVSAALSSDWQIPADAARRDVAAIVSDWRGRGLLSDSSPAVHARPGVELEPFEHRSHDDLVRWTCSIRRRAVGFAVAAGLAGHVRNLFAHLETDRMVPEFTLVLAADGTGDFLLVEDGQVLLRTREAAIATGALHIAVLERVRPGVQWFALMHGAALARGDHGFALAGVSGAGKSTLTAGLMAAGFDYLSDDLVALAAPSATIVPWPLPLSVKPGSIEFLSQRFPSLASAASYPTKGTMARLILPAPEAWDREPVALRTLFFPRFLADAAPSARRLAPIDVLTAVLNDRIWIGDPIAEAQVEQFLAWIVRTPAYALTYGTLADSLELVNGLIQ